MIRNFYVKRLIKKGLLLKAISFDKNNKISSVKKILFYHKLGMHKTVANFSMKKISLNVLVSKITSHCVCGEFDIAKDLIKEFKSRQDHEKYLVKLSDSICSFIPDEAIKLISDKKPEPLYSSILLTLNRKIDANKRLYYLIKDKSYRKKPEILLYYANSKENITKNESIKYLNMYLNLFKIPKVKLTDKSKDLNVMNLSSNYHEEFLHGPLVTILMTAYNIGERINTTIQSVLNQSYKNIELIIIDDASTDNTLDIIRLWEDKDKRIKVIPLNINVGTFVAKNVGLLKANGEFITCHDSDDWSHPIKIQRQVLPLIEDKELIASISSWIRIDDFGNYYVRAVHPLSRINPSSLMFRKKEVLKKAGLWDCVRTGADSEFIARLKIIFGEEKVKRIKEALSFGAHRDDSLMTAKDTGYSEKGMSKERLEYWESWNKWHMDCLSKWRKPKLTINSLFKRKFDVPKTIVVPSEDIKNTFKTNK